MSTMTTKPALILGSASPARRATLSAAQIAHTVHVSHVDEDAILEDLRASAQAANQPLTAKDQVAALARAKAQAVAEEVRENLAGSAVTHPILVVGCDSMFDMDGEVVGKPHTPEIARERLRKMSGNPGDLYTGHCVIDVFNGAEAQGVSHARVHIGKLSDAEIEAYIASGEPLEVAGSFTIDGRGGPFVERIEGDHHGVVGISLPLLRSLLAELGYSITNFWL